MMRLVARALLLACIAAIAIPRAMTVGAAPPGAAAPDPSTLLLAPGDLPPGYLRDDAVENADATARTAAYGASIMSSSFAAYRRRDGAVVQHVALLRGRADAATLLAREAAAVGGTHSAARLTIAVPPGTPTPLAYQQRGTRGELWVMALFAAGPYATVVGAYDKGDEQASIDLVRRLVPMLGARLRAAAGRTPDPTPPRATARTTLRIVALVTTTRDKRAASTVPPRGTLYWRAVWRIGRPPRGARETVRETVWRGKAVLYSNGFADAPYEGDNEADDHLALPGLAPGRYNVTIAVTVGRLSAGATRAFRVVAPATPG
jgi:hypothetical protein